MTEAHHRRRRLGVLAALLTILGLALPATALAVNPTDGVSAVAGDARVDITWRPVTGATSYAVYRGTTATSITTLVGTATGTTLADTGRTNNTTYYYVVRARQSTTESVNSEIMQVKPKARSCSTGNVVVVENCFPGDTTWKTVDTASIFNGGVVGYATTQSVNRGDTIDVKANADWDTQLRVEIYRTGYYGGVGARLFSSILHVDATRFANCSDNDTTGLYECGSWDTTVRIPTSTAWPSGIYLLRLVREDTGSDTHVLIVVRDDSRGAQLLYGLPMSTYQAYNNYGGRSVYDWGSTGTNTVAGTPRAVAVSFDRPYAQVSNPYLHDWFTRTDQSTTTWLERMGVDVSYVSDTDLETTPSLVLGHKAYIGGSHDEYWSAGMRTALLNARNAVAKVNLFFQGANELYWKVRFTTNPTTGTANRTMVVYKSTQSGPPDPSGIPTGTWRDPAGANSPENSLMGQQYVGDNDGQNFPFVVGASEGTDRVWRFTGLDAQAPGTSTSIGTGLVGWEWNARFANGLEPAGLTVLASSPVTGNLIQANGAYTTPGPTTATMTKYTAASGALVVNAGTIFWGHGLALDGQGGGEPDIRIQQATTNILVDMGVTPTTPMAGIVVSANWSPAVLSTIPAANDTFAGLTSPVTATFTRAIDPTTLTPTTFKLTTGGGATVPATVSYNATTRTASATPSSPLVRDTPYTATLTTGVKATDGSPLVANYVWSFRTSTCPCNLHAASATPAATGQNADDGRPAAGGPWSLELGMKITVDQPTTVTALRFYKSPGEDGTHVGRLWTSTGTSVATATYVGETASGWQSQTLASPVVLQPGTTYVVSINANTKYVATLSGLASQLKAGVLKSVVGGNGVYATTGGQFPASTYQNSDYFVDLTFVPGGDPVPVDVIATSPSNGDTGVATGSAVTATFSRDVVNADGTTFTLTGPGGVAVPGTVTYNAGTKTVSLQPTSQFAAGAVYTARLDTSISTSDGQTLGHNVTWSFTADACPCSLFSALLAPQFGGNPTQDGRWSGAPYSYEMGVKITVQRTAILTGIRYYRDPLETGTHVGRVWTASGTPIASVTFDSETGSGWQVQALPSAVTLTPGTTYVISVNRNDYYGFTPAALASQVSNGPLRSVVGGNAVYALTAGQFPSLSYNNSNYFTDVVVS